MKIPTPLIAAIGLNPLFKVGAVKLTFVIPIEGRKRLNPLFKVGAVKRGGGVISNSIKNGLNPLFKVGAVKLIGYLGANPETVSIPFSKSGRSNIIR